MNTEKVDVLVIGAGPSGAVAASMVHKSGLKVKVVEKQQFPRFVIGESLLPRCMEHLEKAGFLDAVKHACFQEKFGAKFVRGEENCVFDFSEQFTEGWKWTWQVPRADFDTILATELAKMGIPVEFQTGVTAIEFNGSNSITTVEDKEGNKSQIEAKFVIDSSGYGRVLPRLLDLDKPSGLPPRKAFFTHIKDTHRPEGIDGNRITVFIQKEDVWVWIIPFSNGITSVGYVGDPAFFDDFEGTPEESFRAMVNANDLVKERIGDAEFVFEPRVLQAYSTSIKRLYGDGFALTGNSSEFLDPIFSSGVTFALESGTLAGELASRQIKGERVDWEKEFTQHIMQGVDTFRTYVMAWYDGSLQDIFFAPTIDENIKRQICSVLAGYVWDLDNPYVRKHDRAIKALSHVIRSMRPESKV